MVLIKKILIYSLLLCFIIIIAKYGLSNYKMSYKIDNYSINMKYKNSRFYYEIKDGDITYNFDIYANRSFKKQEISKIEKISDEKFECIYPNIKNVDTYPLCSINKEIVDFHLIDSELLDKYKKAKEEDNKLDRDFIYYNNLSNNEYVALWNYKGYIVMNGNNYNNVDMFEKGIIDPVKVTKSALLNATSISSMLLTTEAAIVKVPEKEQVNLQGLLGR